MDTRELIAAAKAKPYAANTAAMAAVALVVCAFAELWSLAGLAVVALALTAIPLMREYRRRKAP